MPYLFKLVKRLSINDVRPDKSGRSFFGANPSVVKNRLLKTVRHPVNVCAKTLVSLVLLSMVACADAADPTDPVFQSTGIVAMQLWPQEPTIEVGDSIDFVAVGLTAAGDTVVVLDVTWSARGGEIRGNGKGKGRYKARAVGRNKVIAVKDSLSDSTTVTVTEVPVASVEVMPNNAAIEVGETLRLTAVAKDAHGNQLIGRPAEWVSSNSTAATVDDAGLVTGGSAGFSTVRATCEGQSGTAQVMVTASAQPVATIDVTPVAAAIQVGGTVQLNATPRDAAGNALPNRLIVWTSAEDHIAIVNGSGLVTAVALGAATITATSEGQSGSAQVTVTDAPPPPVASVEVTPATAEVEVGASRRLTAIARDAAGNEVTGSDTSWATSDGALATVNRNGRVTGQAPGPATITATIDGQSGTAQVTVTAAAPPPVASVDVTPSSLSLSVGQTGQLTAVMKDAAGNDLSGRVASWASSDDAVAAVNANGLVTARASGAATITATSEGQSGTAALAVTQVPVASVEVTPTTASMAVGGTVQLTATVRDATGNELAGRAVTWSTSDGAVATVSTSGRVSGVGVGSATVTATSEGQSGTAAVSVTAAPPPPPGGAADPTLLPVASGQQPDLGGYPGASIGAGQTYLDPATGVTVLRVTDGSTPFGGNGRGVPDYAEGGPHISQAWQEGGETYYTLYLMVGESPSTHYLVDVRFSDMTAHNWRQLPSMTNRDLLWAWSLDPATPRVGYGFDMPGSSTLRKFDTGSMTEVTGGNFPKGIPNDGSWLSVSVNDEWFSFQERGGGGPVYAWNPRTDQLHTWTLSGLDEPHIDRSGDYVYVIANGSCGPLDGYSRIRLFSTATGDEVPMTPNIQVDGWHSGCENMVHGAHFGGLRGFAVSYNPHVSNGTMGRHEYRYDPVADEVTFVHDESTIFTGSVHRAGQWVFGNRLGSAQWYLTSNWGSGGALSDAIAFLPADQSDSPRLLAHHYSEEVSASGYLAQPHATVSPDGKLVLWGSNMTSPGGRVDAFVARVPTR